MTFELLIDTCRPGTLDDALKSLDLEGQMADKQAREKLEAAWTTEFGEADQVISLWRLPDHEISAGQTSPAQSMGHAGTSDLVRKTRRLQLEMPFDKQFTGGHFYDYRTYTLHPGARDIFMGHMRKVLPVRTRHSRNVGVWTPLDGNRDQIIHLWAYRDLADRARARAAAWQEPAWQAYLAHIFPLVLRMQNAMLVPAPFSPMQ